MSTIIDRIESETTFMNDNNGSAAVGYQKHKRGGVIAFSIEGMTDLDGDRVNSYRKAYDSLISEQNTMVVGDGIHIPLWGDRHNLYPLEVEMIIRDNKLLPSILRKQEDFLFGHGPILYTEVIEDGKRVRQLVRDSEVEAWLNSWEEYGYESYTDYLRALIEDYYRVHTCCTQYHFTNNRRSLDDQQGSIIALSYVGADRTRLATRTDPSTVTIQNRHCDLVAVGDWLHPNMRQVEIFPRFKPADPYKSAGAISFNAEKTFGQNIYAYNHWFNGLREWIKASNLTPKYLNSYLQNALNAHVHVRIPLAWVNAQQENLQSLCRQNLNCSPEERVPEYRGVRLIDSKTKRPYRYSINMIEDLIASELEKITSLLSGEGKNQGKLYATTKVGQEGWEFEDFPGKFKEYFDSVIAYDKRADQVTLAGIGINSSITNVENDGVISKSGSDVYYNYVVYMSTLAYAESFICKDINRALRLNFPEKDIKVGFDIQIPMRQQEISPKDRI